MALGLDKYFFPSHEFVHKLDFRTKNQLSLLIHGNQGAIGLFFIFGLVCCLQKKFEVGLVSLFAVICFFISLSIIKKEKIQTATIFTTLGFLSATFVVTFFSTMYQSPLVFYRPILFMCAIATINAYIALGLRQIVMYFIPCVIMWAVSLLTIYKPVFAMDFSDAMLNFCICTIALSTTNLMILLSNRFNRFLISKSEDEQIKAKVMLKEITVVLDEAKEGLDIGHKLTGSADKANDAVAKIQEIYRLLTSDAVALNKDANDVKGVGTRINEQAAKMKASVQEQNASITQTSAAMTQISANISNISTIASKRRAAMDEIVQALSMQLNQVRALVEEMNQVKESSNRIEAFVSTVDSIASQTGLLAMNASIEAAHAGTLGKGFSVIAQEIRKLSEETTKNANQISETLQGNGALVQQAAESANTMANFTSKSAQDIRTTVEAIDEILSGIGEMDIGTREVMKALQNIVDESHKTGELVAGVVKEIADQGESLENIAGVSGNLEERIEGLHKQMSLIGASIEEIKNEATANVDMTSKMSDSLGDVYAQSL